VHLAAVAQASGQIDQRAAGSDPYVTPLSSTWNEKAEAGSSGPAGSLPALDDSAAAVVARDGRVADQCAVDGPHLPASDPEIELRCLGDAEAGADSPPDVAHDALETRIAADRVEIGRALEEGRRTRLEVVRRFERGERVVAPAEREQISRALDLDHRLRRVRGTGPLERVEGPLVPTELAFGLRDAQPAEPIVRRFRDELAIGLDRVLPPPLLQREVGRMRERLGLTERGPR